MIERDLAIKMATDNGGKFESITWASEPKFKKGFPLEDVLKITRAFNIQNGVKYINLMNNKRERMGLPRDFVPKAMNGKVWYEYPLVSQSVKDADKYYLRITLTDATRFETAYFVGGRLASKEEMETILAYKYASSQTPTDIMDITLNYIIEWKIGKNTYRDALATTER